jgi:hypothetical protein
MWFTEGPQNNPPDGTVLADTGPFSPERGRSEFPAVLASSDADVNVVLQLRNAANDGNVKQQGFALLARVPLVVPVLGCLTIEAGQRLRLVTAGVAAGRVSASIVLSCNGA